jgi:hypothetical protein
MGAKWPRYLLSLMPFILHGCGRSVMVLIRWATSTFEEMERQGAVTLIATAALLLATVIWRRSLHTRARHTTRSTRT